VLLGGALTQRARRAARAAQRAPRRERALTPVFPRQGFTVATVYTSLGAGGVEHALAESAAAAVVTDGAGVRLMCQTSAAAQAQRIVLLPPRGADAAAAAADAAAARAALPVGTQAHTWRDVAEAAPRADAVAPRRAPAPADTALLMFTSGSTGAPKGVLISHGAAIAAVAGIVTWNAHEARRLTPLARAHGGPGVTAPAGDADVAIAYLPLAHIFELVAENAVALAAGSRLGYGHPATLTDGAPGVQRGTAGDAPALAPTFLTAVPTVLERVRAAVAGALGSLRGVRGVAARAAFTAAFAVGDAALRCGVYGNGAAVAAARRSRLADALAARCAPALCALVFRRARAALGGRVRFFLSGGAPLSASTQRFLAVVFGCPVLQGYGLTETCCIGTLTSPADLQAGRVGAPVPSGLIKLVPWPEGGYTPADAPLPRGEVHIGGPALADGYHALPEQTKADFYSDTHGVRWFRTGDIGQVTPDGVLQIIDRRKDLVKLERGEYLSLGKVEAALQTECALVAHALVAAQGHMRAPVALVVPHVRALRDALRGGDAPPDNVEGGDEALLRCPAAQRAVLRDIDAAARRAGLERWEVPTAVRLVPGPWTPESGLVTAALKVRRQAVHAAFRAQLQEMMPPAPK
jgi:long-chain acyl-CoA synthetase